MASHHPNRGKVIELWPTPTREQQERWVRPEAYPDPIELLRLRRPTTLQKIVDAIDSPLGLGICIGFVVGCFFTVGAAAVWARVLL